MNVKLRSVARVLIVFSVIVTLTFLALSIPPVFATPIFEDGFESGDFSAWTGTGTSTGGMLTVQSTIVKEGSYAAKANDTDWYGEARCYYGLSYASNLNEAYARAYFRFADDLPSDTDDYMRLIVFRDMEDYTDRVYVSVDHDGSNPVLELGDGTNTDQGSTVIATGKWYCIEIHADYSTGDHELFLDGNSEASISGGVSGETVRYFYFGIKNSQKDSGETFTVYSDCVVIDTAYIGPECTLNVNVVGSGSVAKIPDQAIYNWGTNVTLTATPTIGWSFEHWSGDASGTANPITVNMTNDKDVTATFTQNTYTLDVSTVGSGSVNLNNSGPYYYGDVIELTAVPNIGWSFQSWSGDVSGSSNPTTLLINGNKTVTATFTQNVYTLTTTVIGNGVIIRNSTGPYHYGDTVKLTAVPDAGWIFDQWGWDLSGSTNPTTILITENKDVKATFTPVPVGGYSIQISTRDIVQPAAAYSVLTCLFGIVLAALRCKRR